MKLKKISCVLQDGTISIVADNVYVISHFMFGVSSYYYVPHENWEKHKQLHNRTDSDICLDIISDAVSGSCQLVGDSFIIENK